MYEDVLTSLSNRGAPHFSACPREGGDGNPSILFCSEIASQGLAMTQSYLIVQSTLNFRERENYY